MYNKNSELEQLISGINLASINIEELLNAKAMQRKKFLEQHKYPIKQMKDGRYYTRIPDASKPKGFNTVAKRSEEELINYLIDYYRVLSSTGYTPQKKCTFIYFF